MVGVDDSPGAQRALEWALAEAAVHQWTVRLVHAIPPIQSLYPYGMGEMVWLDDINEGAEKAARELLDAALAQAGGAPAGVAVEYVTRFAPAANLLVEESRGKALLVVGSRGRGGFTGLLLGSVSQQVAHHADCPVVVIPAER
ncbi:MAG: universal stress protein [Egibacteraceae bacterium]